MQQAIGREIAAKRRRARDRAHGQATRLPPCFLAPHSPTAEPFPGSAVRSMGRSHSTAKAVVIGGKVKAKPRANRTALAMSTLRRLTLPAALVGPRPTKLMT